MPTCLRAVAAHSWTHTCLLPLLVTHHRQHARAHLVLLHPDDEHSVRPPGIFVVLNHACLPACRWRRHSWTMPTLLLRSPTGGISGLSLCSTGQACRSRHGPSTSVYVSLLRARSLRQATSSNCSAAEQGVCRPLPLPGLLS
jgi:hypothetical protein